MIDECVVAVYPTLEKARKAVHGLTETGFPASQISLVTAALKDRPELLEQLELSDDSLYDAAIGAELGSIVGILTGLAATVVSGLGVLFFIGPIAAIAGGITGGFIGAMEGWGVHKRQIKHYERLIETGNVIIIANGNPVELAGASQQLQNTDASEVHTYARSDDEEDGIIR